MYWRQVCKEPAVRAEELAAAGDDYAGRRPGPVQGDIPQGQLQVIS